MTIAPFPNNTRQQIEEMIEQDGRPVTFYIVESTTECPMCSLDPISNTSTDSFCPTCSGEYWIPVYSGWTITAHVTWGKADNRAWETGGMLDNGDCSVKFMYSGAYQNFVEISEYAIIDSRIMDVQRVIPRGVPEINRLIVELKEREK